MMKRLSIIMMCLLAMVTVCLSDIAQESMISFTSVWNRINSSDTLNTKHGEVVSGFVPMGDDTIRSQFCFIADGNWNDGSKWNMGEVPPIGSDVVIMADVVIPSGYTAVANEVSIDGGSITVADGGQLRHNTANLVVTMKKSIEPYCEINGIGNYYLLGFPFSENVDVPAIMTAAPGNDFYKFDSNSSGTEWRNNKQEAVATVGGTNGYLYASPDAIELSLTGKTYTSYHEETKTVTIPYSEDSTNLFNGWALLGNPYTCNAYIYCYNRDNELVPMDYMVYDTNGELMTLSGEPIAPMQGFFVKVTENTMVFIKNYADHEYVDLGLPSGTLWATCNVGAYAPEEYGDYFAWGETQPKEYYDWSTYQYSNGGTSWENPNLIKYCNDSSYGYNGFKDGLTILLPEDDAATANWGAGWRVPTQAEWQELLDNTTHTWTIQNGVCGTLFTASNDASLFLPATGYCNDSSLYVAGSCGYYWSSSLRTYYPGDARSLFFYSYSCDINFSPRRCGQSVRAVRASSQNNYYIINATANPVEGGYVNGGGTYQEDTECTLTVMANEGYTFSNWTENDEVISVDATYSFTVMDNRNIVANFIVSSGNEHGYVDLGLPSGTLWATCNVGANVPEEYGDYFAWGETQVKEIYSWNTYQYSNGSSNTLTKYCSKSGYGYNGFTDNLTNLLPEDDPATASWGSDWRVPTEPELQELLDNTTSVWTTQNGVNGRLFTASNGNSLFLPAAGYHIGSNLNFSDYGFYWSSSLETDYPCDTWGFDFSSDEYYEGSYNRCWGLSVRAVRSFSQYNHFIINAAANPVEGGYVNGAGTYQEGSRCTLTAMANEGYTFSNWMENDEVISINAAYSFTVMDNRNIVANFIVSSGNEHGYVDLGLPSGTLWATCNVGANAPEEYGDYYSWGETLPKDNYVWWDNYQYCNGSDHTLTKYCNNSDFGYNGFIDNLTVLLPEDDAATTNWGNDWHIPTKEEWQELFNNTSSTWTTQNGVNGRLFTVSNGNSLFLPAAGHGGYYGNPVNVGTGYYWSSSLYLDTPSQAWHFNFYLGNNYLYNINRFCGCSVRAVRSSMQIVIPPTVTTIQVTNITQTTAICGGNVTNDGGGAVTERGICWSTSHYPTTSGNHANSGTGTGSYSINMTGLTANTTYYVRAYATNSEGTAYGSEVSFTTLQNVSQPTVTTSEVTNISQTSATGGGNVISDGGSAISIRGICWSTSHNPTTNSNHYNTSGTTGSFSINMNNLTANTTYYVRAYATNSAGTAYGNEVSFITPQALQTYTITVSANPITGGTISGGGTYQQGQSCTVTAIAASGYTFIKWTENGTQVSTNPNYTFTVAINRNLVAHFTCHEYVDLGLPSGTFWATCNIGATTPEDYGDYFAWGETLPKSTYNWSTYQYCFGGEGWNTLVKYCTDPEFGYNGFIDNLTTLLPGDDAATVNWGTDWRMPTHEEWQELLDNTTCILTTQNGVNGRLFTANNGNSLFLPAAGSRDESNPPSGVGYFGYYWSSSLVTDAPVLSWDLMFYSNNCNFSSHMRYYGFSVRAVRSFTKTK